MEEYPEHDLVNQQVEIKLGPERSVRGEQGHCKTDGWTGPIRRTPGLVLADKIRHVMGSP